MIIEIDFLYRWAVLERRPNHVNKQPSGCWHLTFDCFLNLDMRDDTNTKFLLLRVQTAYDLGNERWLFGDIIDHVGIYGSRLAEGLSASNVGLVLVTNIDIIHHNLTVFNDTQESSLGKWHAKWHSWWRHQIETFPALLAICAGNSPVSGEFPAQRPVTRSFDVSFDLYLIPD